MRTCAGAACHLSGDGVALNARKLAQVLERLGIALADNVGVFVTVEDVCQLEGIAVGSARSGFGVIAYHFADFVFKGLQLVGVAAGCT